MPQAQEVGLEKKPLPADVGLEAKPLPDEDAGTKPETIEARRKKIRERAAALKGHEPVYEAARGAVRGAVSTVQGLASPIRKAFGMAPAEPPQAETTTAGKVGRGAEQVGEFFLPGKVAQGAGRVGKAAVEGAGTYAVAKAQGDPHPIMAAAMASVLAPFGAIEKMAPGLREGAEKSMGKVLSTGADVMKKSVQKAIHESVGRALDLGISPTWRKVLARAEAVKETAGEAVKTTVAGPAGSTAVSTKPVVDALEALLSKAQNLVPVSKTGVPMGAKFTANNVREAVTFNKRLVSKVEELKKIIENHGPTVEARQLHNIKEDWNTFVYKAQSYVNASKIKLNLEARAKKAATDAMRGVLDREAPTIAAVDKEYHFARQTSDVIADAAGVGKLTPAAQAARTAAGQTVRRAVTAVGAGIGGVAGAAVGRSPTAAAIGSAFGAGTSLLLEKAFRSPGWKLLPATIKNQLATALAAGKAETVRRLLAPLITAGTAKKPTEAPKAKVSTGARITADPERQFLADLEQSPNAVRAEMPLAPGEFGNVGEAKKTLEAFEAIFKRATSAGGRYGPESVPKILPRIKDLMEKAGGG
jgi:hypothetical protein